MEHNSVMWQYMAEEEKVLSAIIGRNDINEVAEQIKNVEELVFVCHGSSFNAAVVSGPFFAKVAKARITTITAGNFMDNEEVVATFNPERTMVVFISQTGNSRGTVVACELAKKYGLKTLGISGKADVLLAKYADHMISLECGEEDSNAKTKGFSATIMVLLNLAVALGKAKGVIDDAAVEFIQKEMKDEVKGLPAFKEEVFKWCEKVDFGKNINNLYIFGSNMNYGTALEAEIKMTETMLVPTVACDTVEFSHGIHRSINSGCTLLIVRSPGNADFAKKSYDFLKNKAQCYMINVADPIEDPNVVNAKWFSTTESVFSVVQYIQVVSAFGPENLGLDPNRDANNDYADAVETRI